MQVHFFDDAWKIFSFFGIQYIFGRRGSYPYGLLVNYSLIKITILVLISDVLQVLLLLNFLDFLKSKISWLRKKNQDYEMENQGGGSHGRKHKFWNRLKELGGFAVILVAALPYGGGALTGSIFANSLGIPRVKSFFLIISGCVIGAILFYLGFAGILGLVK